MSSSEGRRLQRVLRDPADLTESDFSGRVTRYLFNAEAAVNRFVSGSDVGHALRTQRNAHRVVALVKERGINL